MPDDIASDPELVKAFTVAFEKRLELRRREFRGEKPAGDVRRVRWLSE